MVKLDGESSHISFEEIEEIIVLLKQVSGFDLSGYTRSSLKRRMERIMGLDNMDFIDLKNALTNVSGFQTYLMHEITVNVTEMFRDPEFYHELNSSVISYLRTFPRVKVWSAGCSSGEEAYSLAILLSENKLYDRSFIYGTDVNSAIIETARKGIFPLQKIKTYTENFNRFNGESSFGHYYTVKYDMAIMSNILRKNILFSTHNLATDAVFNEFQLITCRNVLIYFDLDLQHRVFQLLYDSLSPFGFLCLGTKESLIKHDIKDKFRVVSRKYNIYQKIK
ncbi:protein-glutamate O-methyltransferase CheR [Sphingobacterium sp. lm-10]|uniref:CheR family methyltransferase n=1 Tax=Sphingobacterium sp. lm-10 TaxID=2944904 RepID=UPI0020200D77|nr:protein-glutamate O-methyltransferase CheR [Sphingobacterium sp. lm-10]MCL7988129.1 protein-glutamate O-methyltransferase CheR [Sphingobacterium sp. lm-10]